MQFNTDKECEEFLCQLLGGEKEPLVKEAVNTIKVRSTWYDPKLYSEVLPGRALTSFLKNKGLHSIKLLNSLEGKIGNWVVLNLDNRAGLIKNKVSQLYNGQITTINSSDEQSLVSQLAATLADNELTEANEILIMLYSQNPWFFKRKENRDLGLKFAEALLNQHKFQKALDWYTCLLKEEPTNPDIYLGLGSIYMALNDLELAISYFLGGLDLNPGHVLLCFNACLILERIGEVELAIEEVEAALDINPDSAMLHKLAGDLFFKDTDNLEGVLEHYKKAVFLISDTESSDLLIKLLNNYCLALAEDGDLDVAERMIHESYHLDELREDTLINLSAFYGFYKLEYDLAIEYAQKALLIDPDSGKAYHNLGLAFLAKGNWDRACFCLYRAKRLLPKDYTPISNALAQLHAKKP
ncbi:MAG: tetratricopeptide repeat protein [Firmicutes bacterium]|nr:tetratricopeptide repeat protein [Bacillota bacterium]MDD4692822.1 tetratricopeptide repeat protein [Bacillota bacterium]